MLRMYFVQQWYGLADEAVEDALYDSQALRDCQSAPHSFQFSAFGNSQRAAYNLVQHQHDWQKLMLIAGKNSALIYTWREPSSRH